jgi:hypothetical protein
MQFFATAAVCLTMTLVPSTADAKLTTNVRGNGTSERAEERKLPKKKGSKSYPVPTTKKSKAKKSSTTGYPGPARN